MMTAYIICTAPRSGSWMLCSALGQTGVAGRPYEFFGPTLAEEFLGNDRMLHAQDVHDTMECVRAKGTTPNGVFGLKLIASQTPIFLYKAAEHMGITFSSLREALEMEYPHVQYLFLTRENKIAQAISLYKASMTGRWFQLEDAPTPSSTPLAYNHFGVQRCYQHILASDRYWETFFKTHEVTPLRVTYESLTQHYELTVRGVLNYLQLSTNTAFLAPKTRKLADEQSLAWEKEFRNNGTIPGITAADALNVWAPY